MFTSVKRVAIASVVLGCVATAAAVFAHDTGSHMGSKENTTAPGTMRDGGMAGMTKMMSMMAKMGPMMDACTRTMERMASPPPGGQGKAPEKRD